jgi:hypothetical protein
LKLLILWGGGLLFGNSEAGAAKPNSWDETGSWSVLGKIYLKKFPNERDQKLLLRLLNLKNCRQPWSVKEIASLSKEIQEDAANDNFVDLDGWMISRTEARIFAVVSMG